MNTATAPRTPTLSPTRIVSDAQVERALSWLRDNAAEIGEARAQSIRADKYLDHLEALLARRSDETSDLKRKAEARASDEWLTAATEAAVAAGRFEELRALREAASACIECWRSEQANYRRMTV